MSPSECSLLRRIPDNQHNSDDMDYSLIFFGFDFVRNNR